MSRVKRLSSLGAGGHGRLSHFKMYDGAVLTAVYDPSRKSIRQTRKLVGRRNLTVCTSPQQLLAQPNIDAVLIMTPDGTHPELLELVVQAGKSVLCEKPLAIDALGLSRLSNALQLAERQGLLVASCHARRDLHNTDLPYGWVKANLGRLIQQYGPLVSIGLNSIYPQPRTAWKEDRSFLMDKFVHDIDYLRFLLGNVPFTAQRLVDSHNHYEVVGNIGRADGPVSFHCQGTRLHHAKDEFIETIRLNFAHGECVVYTKTGLVRVRDYRTDHRSTVEISRMNKAGYNRVFSGIMRDFVTALDGGPRTHTSHDLWVITEAVVALATTSRGEYSYPGA